MVVLRREKPRASLVATDLLVVHLTTGVYVCTACVICLIPKEQMKMEKLSRGQEKKVYFWRLLSVLMLLWFLCFYQVFGDHWFLKLCLYHFYFLGCRSTHFNKVQSALFYILTSSWWSDVSFLPNTGTNKNRPSCMHVHTHTVYRIEIIISAVGQLHSPNHKRIEGRLTKTGKESHFKSIISWVALVVQTNTWGNYVG